MRTLFEPPTLGGVGAIVTSCAYVCREEHPNPRMLGDGVPGAIGVLHKPTDPHTIRQTVEYVLGLKGAESQMMQPPSALTVFSPQERRA